MILINCTRQLLRKEMDLLRDNVLKAESVIRAAKKKYNDESIKLDELQSQFKAADKIRQEAYANLQSLRKQLYEKVCNRIFLLIMQSTCGKHSRRHCL